MSRVESGAVRPDHKTILGWIRPGTSVLDLGCGNGVLLELLAREKNARVQGIEVDGQAIYDCVAKGLSVFHEDIDEGLTAYADASFDYVILNQSLQQVRRLDDVMREALRVGNRVVVGFPNFAQYRSRCQIFFRGKTPITTSLPFAWHDTPNLHFLTISDFVFYCREKQIRIHQSSFLGRKRSVRFLPNFLAHVGIFLISSGRS
jgi:methionine biosynthesis protein MetW